MPEKKSFDKQLLTTGVCLQLLVTSAQSSSTQDQNPMNDYSEWEVDTKEWATNRKNITNGLGSLDPHKLAAGMVYPESQETYTELKDKWDLVDRFYQTNGCMPPPPPVTVHHQRLSPIEKQCQAGYKKGFEQSEEWVKVIITSDPDPKTGQLIDQQYLKNQLNYFMTCIVNYFRFSEGIYGMCGIQGVTQGMEHWTDMYGTDKDAHGKAHTGQHKKDLAKQNEKKYIDTYESMIKETIEQTCLPFKFKGNPTQNSPTLCGSQNSDRYYCQNPIWPVCIPNSQNQGSTALDGKCAGEIQHEILLSQIFSATHLPIGDSSNGWEGGTCTCPDQTEFVNVGVRKTGLGDYYGQCEGGAITITEPANVKLEELVAVWCGGTENRSKDNDVWEAQNRHERIISSDMTLTFVEDAAHFTSNEYQSHFSMAYIPINCLLNIRNDVYPHLGSSNRGAWKTWLDATTHTLANGTFGDPILFNSALNHEPKETKLENSNLIGVMIKQGCSVKTFTSSTNDESEVDVLLSTCECDNNTSGSWPVWDSNPDTIAEWKEAGAFDAAKICQTMLNTMCPHQTANPGCKVRGKKYYAMGVFIEPVFYFQYEDSETANSEKTQEIVCWECGRRLNVVQPDGATSEQQSKGQNEKGGSICLNNIGAQSTGDTIKRRDYEWPTGNKYSASCAAEPASTPEETQPLAEAQPTPEFPATLLNLKDPIPELRAPLLDHNLPNQIESQSQNN